MLNNRLIFLLSALLIITLSVSCSSTSGTAKKAPEKSTAESKYPSWYTGNRSVQSDSTAYYGYATALASDSAQSSEKAVAQAKAELKSAISGRLESIRNNVVDKLGSDSGLDNPGFIVTLRNAENRISAVSNVIEMEVEKDGEKVFRAFSKVAADKEALIAELDKAFSGNGNAWNTMKESQAFTNF